MTSKNFRFNHGKQPSFRQRQMEQRHLYSSFFTSAIVESLVKDPKSGIESFLVKKVVSMHCRFIGRVSEGINHELNKELFKYCQKYEGIVVAFGKPTLLASDAPSFEHDHRWVYLTISTMVYVFKPSPRDVLSAIVTDRSSPSSWGCQIHTVFNAAVSVDNELEVVANLEDGDQIEFEVTRVFFTSDTVSIEGHLVGAVDISVSHNVDSNSSTDKSLEEKPSELLKEPSTVDVQRKLQTNALNPSTTTDPINIVLSSVYSPSLFPSTSTKADVELAKVERKKKRREESKEKEINDVTEELTIDSQIKTKKRKSNKEQQFLQPSIDGDQSTDECKNSSASSEKKSKKKKKDRESLSSTVISCSSLSSALSSSTIGQSSTAAFLCSTTIGSPPSVVQSVGGGKEKKAKRKKEKHRDSEKGSDGIPELVLDSRKDDEDDDCVSMKSLDTILNLDDDDADFKSPPKKKKKVRP